MTRVVVIIVNYRTPDLTERCLAALLRERASLPGLKAIVVDGGSGDGSADQLTEFVATAQYTGWVSLLPLAVNGGFGWANNQAVLTLARSDSPPEYIHFLNPDTEVKPGAVLTLVDELRAFPRCGAAGSQLLAPDGEASASAFRFPSPGREFLGCAQSEVIGRLFGIDPIVIRSAHSRNVDWVTGASVMFRSQALRQTGLFDDGFFLYFEEVELMHRLQREGWEVRFVPGSRVVHLQGSATGVGGASVIQSLPEYWYRSRQRYFALTGGRARVLVANLASIAGSAAALIKKLGGRQSAGQAARASELLRLGLLPRSSDLLPAKTWWGDIPGKKPTWMTA